MCLIDKLAGFKSAQLSTMATAMTLIVSFSVISFHRAAAEDAAINGTGQPGPYCGRFNVLGKVNVESANKFLDAMLTLNSMIYPESHTERWVGKTVPCNILGDEFQVCRACQEEITQEQMDAIRPMLTSSSHRIWHDRWHRMWRLSNEVTLDKPFDVLTKDQVDNDNLESLTLLIKEGWLPEHNASQFLTTTQAFRGESFFYMHRQMIKMVNFELTANGLPCIQPWRDLPPIVDKNWPIPRLVHNPKLLSQANQLHDEIESVLRRVSEESYLRTVSLDVLARDITFKDNIHADLHTLYADDKATTQAKCQNDEATSRTCDDLTSDLSSQVNKHFWKLHGLIDNLIGKWLKANDYDIVSENCEGKTRCYKWKGTYLGKLP